TKKFDFLLDIDYDFKSAEQLLLYIIHKMIDSFDKPSKFLAEQVDKMEQTIFLKDFEKVSLEELYFYKSQSRITKKLLQISQNVINHIEVKGENLTALQDIKDSLFSLSLTYDEVLDDAINLTNTYLSFNAQKSNDVMKLLTIFSAFFLPLTFIAGIYGMNFDNMPELKSKNGYYITMGSMLVISICIYAWFKKKKII
ncbi:MAG: CorA family divalent cation transporter, partial [Chitinophagales bacterium]